MALFWPTKRKKKLAGLNLVGTVVVASKVSI